MSMLPKRIHKVVEWHLRNADCIRAMAFAEAEGLRQKANQQAPAPEVPIRGKGGHGDPAGRKAQLLAEADRITRQAPLWAEVVNKTRDCYADSGRMGDFFRLYYGSGLDYGFISRELGVEKTTLYDWREKIVTHAALLAVEKGLIHMAIQTD